MASFLNETGLSTLWNKIKTLVATKQDALPSGTTGQVLTLDSNLAPTWTNPAGGSNDFWIKLIKTETEDAQTGNWSVSYSIDKSWAEVRAAISAGKTLRLYQHDYSGYAAVDYEVLDSIETGTSGLSFVRSDGVRGVVLDIEEGYEGIHVYRLNYDLNYDYSTEKWMSSYTFEDIYNAYLSFNGYIKINGFPAIVYGDWETYCNITVTFIGKYQSSEEPNRLITATGTSTVSNGSDYITLEEVESGATTYSLSMTNNIITLTGSDGSTSSVTLPVYDGAFSVVGEGASF